MGYHLAGFSEIVGIDIAPQPRYPFTFVQGDAMAFVAAHGADFDLIHASPPCQGYSSCRFLPQNEGIEYPKQIEDVRALLRSTGKPYVIENVPQAPLENPLILEGRLFGLKVLRKRLFECTPWLLGPPIPILRRKKHVADISEFDRGQYGFMSVYGQRFSVPAAKKAMGIDWMIRSELAQAIPPAYTRFIGIQMLNILRA
jgi:DNA (cytosine-5)-methyltransferase 1